MTTFLNEDTNNRFSELEITLDYDALLGELTDQLGGGTSNDPVEFFDFTIGSLIDIKNNKTVDIQLYRLVFARTVEDVDLTNIGYSFVGELDDFHEEMIDYLFTNARQLSRT